MAVSWSPENTEKCPKLDLIIQILYSPGTKSIRSWLFLKKHLCLYLLQHIYRVGERRFTIFQGTKRQVSIERSVVWSFHFCRYFCPNNYPNSPQLLMVFLVFNLGADVRHINTKVSKKMSHQSKNMACKHSSSLRFQTKKPETNFLGSLPGPTFHDLGTKRRKKPKIFL